MKDGNKINCNIRGCHMLGMMDSFISGFYYTAKLFLLPLIIVSVYAVNAFGETYIYDGTIGVTGVIGSDNSHFFGHLE